MDRKEALYKLDSPRLDVNFYGDLFVERGKKKILIDTTTGQEQVFIQNSEQLYFKTVRGTWMRMFPNKTFIYDKEEKAPFSGLLMPVQYWINRLHSPSYSGKLSLKEVVSELGIDSKEKPMQINFLRYLFWERMRSIRQDMTLEEIGKLTGGQGHSTLSHGLRTLNEGRGDLPLYLLRRFNSVIERLDFNKTDMIEFEKYDRENPQIYNLFVELAFEARGKGFTKYSANGIFELIRWNTKESGNDGFKLNNNYRPDYARKMMREYPEFQGFFEIRELHTNRK